MDNSVRRACCSLSALQTFAGLFQSYPKPRWYPPQPVFAYTPSGIAFAGGAVGFAHGHRLSSSSSFTPPPSLSDEDGIGLRAVFEFGREFGLAQSSIGVRLWNSCLSVESGDVRQIFRMNAEEEDADCMSGGDCHLLKYPKEAPLQVWSVANRNDLELKKLRNYISTLESKIAFNDEEVTQQQQRVLVLQRSEKALSMECEELRKEKWLKECKIKDLETSMEKANDIIDQLWAELQKSKELIRKKTAESFMFREELHWMHEELNSMKVDPNQISAGYDGLQFNNTCHLSQKGESHMVEASLEASGSINSGSNHGVMDSVERSTEKGLQHRLPDLACQTEAPLDASPSLLSKVLGQEQNGATKSTAQGGKKQVIPPSPFTAESMAKVFGQAN